MPKPKDAFSARLASPVTAKRAILAALTATQRALSTAQLRLCGALFDVEGPAVRVALGRLVDKGDVVSQGEGVYKIGPKGEAIAQAIRRWRDLPRLDRSWNGEWIAIHTAHLGRSRRPQLRRRERALSLFGFASVTDGLWTRPDNLRIEPAALASRLFELGLEPEAILVVGARFIAEPAQGLGCLWDKETIEAGYVAAESAMASCLEGFERASLKERARGTATIGTAVIGMLSFDPLLPRELLDADLRGAVHRRMLEFDRIGKRALVAYWQDHGC
ncbi:MAG: hypothetical protein ACRBN8_08265 [Nannocystales bacterium]